MEKEEYDFVRDFSVINGDIEVGYVVDPKEKGFGCIMIRCGDYPIFLTEEDFEDLQLTINDYLNMKYDESLED
ncbi:MAG: hypothetical protein DRN27_10050 [Thermoplasmata archaeon]|nr:MAG: hypothetical protein DRN27_10050 [Thermoplasmata archaeon]